MHEAGSIYVVGAGGHAKVVIAVARELGLAVDGVFDEDENASGREITWCDGQSPE